MQIKTVQYKQKTTMLLRRRTVVDICLRQRMHILGMLSVTLTFDLENVAVLCGSDNKQL